MKINDEEVRKDRDKGGEVINKKDVGEKPRRKVVSTGILKISEICEKTEKMVLEKVKTGGNVENIKNRFESMMGDTSVRQAKFVVKKRQRKLKKPIYNEEKTATLWRNTLNECA